MKREDYLQKVLKFIDSHEDKEKDFFDKLVLADYGDLIGECDVCGHRIRYAFCLRVDWRFGSPKDTDDNVIIGTTCINKVCSLANMQNKFEEKFKEYKKIITKIRKIDNKKDKRKLFLTIDEAKTELQLAEQRARAKQIDKRKKEFIQKQIDKENKHNELMKTNELYNKLYNKFEGFCTNSHYKDDVELEYNREIYFHINSGNKFLDDLFSNHTIMNMSEKQLHWFNKLGNEYLNKEKVNYDDVKKDLKMLNTKIRLGLYDSGFVDSIEKQVIEKNFLTENQLKALDKIKNKYRKQIEEIKNE